MTRYSLELQCCVTDYNRCPCVNVPIHKKHPSLEIAMHAWKAQRSTGNFPRRKLKRELHVAFKIPLEYDFNTRLCMQQVDVSKKSRECKCFQHWTKLSPTDETYEAVIKVSSPIQINHQPDARIFLFIILTFIYIPGPTTNTARPSPQYEVKTRGCHCSH
jgi:hypothetical protein